MKKIVIGALVALAIPLTSFHFLDAKAAANVLESSTQVTVVDDNQADYLAAGNILSPKENQILQLMPRNIGIGWEKVSDATDYEVELSCMGCGAKSPWEMKVVKKVHYYTHWITPALAHDGTYRVRVRGVTSTGLVGPWSQYRYFSYDTRPVIYVNARKRDFALIPPQVLMPANNETLNNPEKVELAWEPLDEALKYEVELGCRLCHGPSHTWPTSTYTTLNTSLQAEDLPQNQDYRFRVRAVDVNGKVGIWSQYRNFSVK